MLQRNLAILLTLVLVSSARLSADMGSGAAFLKISPGARATAMGDAYTALADGITALHYNPAGLALLQKREIGFTHAEWLLDTQYDFLGYGQATSFGTLGVSVMRLTAGWQEGRDANRQPSSGFDAGDASYSIGLGRRLDSQTRLGVTLKFLTSRIGQHGASALAGDLGVQYRLRKSPLALGATVLNIGPGIRYLDQKDSLPLALALGGSYGLGGVLSLAMSMKYEPYDRKIGIGVGTEYMLFSTLSLRMGYSSFVAQTVTGTTNREFFSSFTGLGGGFGLRLAGYQLDYAFAPFGQFGNVQKFGLTLRF